MSGHLAYLTKKEKPLFENGNRSVGGRACLPHPRADLKDDVLLCMLNRDVVTGHEIRLGGMPSHDSSKWATGQAVQLHGIMEGSFEGLSGFTREGADEATIGGLRRGSSNSGLCWRVPSAVQHASEPMSAAQHARVVSIFN